MPASFACTNVRRSPRSMPAARWRASAPAPLFPPPAFSKLRPTARHMRLSAALARHGDWQRCPWPCTMQMAAATLPSDCSIETCGRVFAQSVMGARTEAGLESAARRWTRKIASFGYPVDLKARARCGCCLFHRREAKSGLYSSRRHACRRGPRTPPQGSADPCSWGWRQLETAGGETPSIMRRCLSVHRRLHSDAVAEWPHCSIGRTASLAALLDWPHCLIGRTVRLAALLEWPHCFIGRTARLAALLDWPHCLIGRTA